MQQSISCLCSTHTAFPEMHDFSCATKSFLRNLNVPRKRCRILTSFTDIVHEWQKEENCFSSVSTILGFYWINKKKKSTCPRFYFEAIFLIKYLSDGNVEIFHNKIPDWWKGGRGCQGLESCQGHTTPFGWGGGGVHSLKL